MGSEDDQTTPALAEARARRRTLHLAIIDLEKAISAPAAGRAKDWTVGVLESMRTLQEAFDRHVEATEKSGGLYDEITAKAPRLSGTVERLHAEHGPITEQIAVILGRLDGGEVGTAAWPLDDARDDLQRLIGRVVRHRQKGADLVWEAYNVDIGGPE